LIAVCGVAVATMAAVCSLSVFNGFQGLMGGMFSAFDPELKITQAKGKVFNPETDLFLKIKSIPEIELISESLEYNALVSYRDREVPIILKGVSNQFASLTDFESLLIDGSVELEREESNYSLLGLGLANNLTVNAGFVYPMEIFAPKRKASVNLSNPTASLAHLYVYIGGVFRTNQAIYDQNYLIVPIRLARELFDYEKEVSALEIKLKPGAAIHQVQNQIQEVLGKDYLVKDRYQQQEDSFKMVNIEKWVTFLMLCFILLIAIFNVIGSLSMLMIEKQSDVLTLRNMGADNRLISQIFLFEGWMISIVGGGIGIILGILLCLGQQYFGWLKLGTGVNFAVDAYPVTVSVSDLLFILLTVLLTGFLAVLYPVRYLAKKMAERMSKIVN
jgi:lipoprotein-releasing system permease protein/zinc transport system substrate-binding protein